MAYSLANASLLYFIFHCSAKIVHLMSLESNILDQLASVQYCSRWVIAYSGGLDSTVLLHLLAKKIPPVRRKPLHVLHINHQLSANADSWQSHCEALALRLNVPLTVRRVTVKNTGQGVESAARNARYREFSAFLTAGDCLLLGHHRHDQAETVLLRLFRGAGVRGLAAIPRQRTLNTGQLLRPLLTISRQQLVDYATREGLTWIDDESNASLTFDRNFIRLQVLPLIEQRWPTASQQLARTAGLMQQAQTLQSEVASDDLTQMDERIERCGYSLSIALLKQLTSARIDNLLRYWIALHNYPTPYHQHLQQLKQQLQQTVNSQKDFIICWSNTELRSFQGRLYLQSVVKAFQVPADYLNWTITEPIILADGSCLTAEPVVGDGLFIGNKNCHIRWRVGGERCRPLGRQHSQTLKKLFQEHRVETWLRDRVPLIYLNGELAAVADLWICHGFAATEEQCGVKLSWQL
jgi:tRNA(Ile)-lysidine synthase